MNLRKWAPYLLGEGRELEMLESLKISMRAESDSGMPFSDACLIAQQLADENDAQMVVGWQINDTTGFREPGWCPVRMLSLMLLEPVALIYPLQREPFKCKR
jgi:hypothetical protein